MSKISVQDIIDGDMWVIEGCYDRSQRVHSDKSPYLEWRPVGFFESMPLAQAIKSLKLISEQSIYRDYTVYRLKNTKTNEIIPAEIF